MSAYIVKYKHQIISLFLLLAYVATLSRPEGFVSIINVILGMYLFVWLNGFLTLRLLFKSVMRTYDQVIISLGLSLLELIIGGLIINTLFSLFVIDRPLSAQYIQAFFVVLLIIKIAFSTTITRVHPRSFTHPIKCLNVRDYIVISLAIISCIGCIAGAFRLNNTGDCTWVVASLIINILAIIITALSTKKLHTVSILTTLVISSINMLLLTSLRSWGIPGQDLKNEFKVYTLTSEVGKWEFSNLANSYNACLSITILPTVLVNLTGVDGVLIFKFFYQIIFSVVILAIYRITQRYTSPLYAFLAAILFVCLPTFSVDMGMQARQLTAYVFYALAMCIWFGNVTKNIRDSSILFGVFSIGIILSHYSTSYVFIATLIGAVTLTAVLNKTSKDLYIGGIYIGFKQAIFVALIGFVWLSLVTPVSGDLTSKISSNFEELYEKIVRHSSTEKASKLDEYIDKTNKSEQSIEEIRPSVHIQSTSEPTAVSSSINQATGIPIDKLVSGFYYTLGPIMIFGSFLLGILYVFYMYKKKYNFIVPVQLALLALTYVGFIGLQAVLPSIANSYGITRTLLQAYVILAVFFAITLHIVFPERHKKLVLIPVVLIAIFYMLYSGLLGQFFGGLRPQFSMNNTGGYYSIYYERQTELTSLKWAASNVPKQKDLRSAEYMYSSILAYEPNYPFGAVGILPFQLRHYDYILFSRSQVLDSQVFVRTNDLTPVYFNKAQYDGMNRIYANPESQIYQPR